MNTLKSHFIFNYRSEGSILWGDWRASHNSVTGFSGLLDLAYNKSGLIMYLVFIWSLGFKLVKQWLNPSFLRWQWFSLDMFYSGSWLLNDLTQFSFNKKERPVMVKWQGQGILHETVIRFCRAKTIKNVSIEDKRSK